MRTEKPGGQVAKRTSSPAWAGPAGLRGKQKPREGITTAAKEATRMWNGCVCTCGIQTLPKCLVSQRAQADGMAVTLTHLSPGATLSILQEPFL